MSHPAEKDAPYVWKRNDRADHDAGHPSGYDCDGYAMGGSESCGHFGRVIPPAKGGAE